jgi:lipid-binding SYLF domain-containing protein
MNPKQSSLDYPRANFGGQTQGRGAGRESAVRNGLIGAPGGRRYSEVVNLRGPLEQVGVFKVSVRSILRYSQFLFLIVAIQPATSIDASAATAREIDVKVDVALERFEKEVGGAKRFLESAEGVLVFPSVIKAGIGIGGEYGEGALRIGGKTVDYYSTAAASIGFQLGAQSRTVILVFLDKKALKDFRNSEGWKAGVDGSVALVTLGAGGAIDSENIKDPIVGFVFSNKGLMYNLTLEGSKYTKLEK